ncbi:MAG: Crp/Fnr family transcriptional regulator [Peptococcaceae bacterium]|nr:Crp/Fnr family transcriptional regulator [Peptococcaceae bacterium]
MGSWEKWCPWTENMIDDQMVHKLLKISTIRKYSKGDVIYWEGLDNRLFLLLAGKVEVSIMSSSGRKRTLAVREARAFIDDAMLDGYFYVVTITCLTPVEIAIFEHDILMRAGYEDPDIFVCMLKSVIIKLQGLSLQLAGQTFDEVESRVYLLLTNLAKEYGQRVEEGICIEKHLTHQFIADLVGSTRVRITQILKNMFANGILGKRGRKIVLLTETDYKNIIMKKK